MSSDESAYLLVNDSKNIPLIDRQDALYDKVKNAMQKKSTLSFKSSNNIFSKFYNVIDNASQRKKMKKPWRIVYYGRIKNYRKISNISSHDEIIAFQLDKYDMPICLLLNCNANFTMEKKLAKKCKLKLYVSIVDHRKWVDIKHRKTLFIVSSIS